MRMQPLLAYWLHSEVDEGAQEKRSLLSTHPLILSSTHFYRSLLTSTDLYSIDEVAAQDKECAIGSRQLSYDAFREGFTWGHKWSSELCKEGKCFCVLVNVVQRRICVWLRSLLKSQWRRCGKDWNTSLASVCGGMQKRILRLHVTNGLAWQWNLNNEKIHS